MDRRYEDNLNEIIFDEVEHTYTNRNTGEQYLNFSKFWELYTGKIVPNLPHIMKAAEYGKTIHRYLQEHLFNGTADFLDEVAFVEDYFQEKSVLKSNPLVVKNVNTKRREENLYNHDLKIAGTSDLIVEFDYYYDDVNFEKNFILADYKTNTEIKREQWTFQLAFYSLMLPKRIISYIVFHLPKNEEFSVVTFSKEEIEEKREIILQFLADRKTKNENAVAVFKRTGEVARFEKFLEREYIIEKFNLAIKQLDEEGKEDEEWALGVMLDNGIANISVDNISITAVAPYENPRIDTTSLKKDLPEIAEKYTKISKVKASLRVKVKGEE